MDDDIAELIGLTTAAPAALDVTTREWLAAHDGWVQALMAVGYSREGATVLVQHWTLRAEQAAREWERIAAQVREVVTVTYTALQPVLDDILKLGVVQDTDPAEPPPRRCPTHGSLLAKGGSCRRCQFGQGQWARDAERRHQQTLRRVRR